MKFRQLLREAAFVLGSFFCIFALPETTSITNKPGASKLL